MQTIEQLYIYMFWYCISLRIGDLIYTRGCGRFFGARGCFWQDQDDEEEGPTGEQSGKVDHFPSSRKSLGRLSQSLPHKSPHFGDLVIGGTQPMDTALPRRILVRCRRISLEELRDNYDSDLVNRQGGPVESCDIVEADLMWKAPGIFRLKISGWFRNPRQQSGLESLRPRTDQGLLACPYVALGWWSLEHFTYVSLAENRRSHLFRNQNSYVLKQMSCFSWLKSLRVFSYVVLVWNRKQISKITL